MRSRHALLFSLLLLAACSLPRQGLKVRPGDAAVPGDAAADGEVDTGAADTGAPDTAPADGCVPTSPPTEICDGIDNDCDPTTLDGAQDPRLLDPCDDDDPDLCVDDVTLCEDGAVVCRPGTTEAVEVCNGVDDDCDTMIDEDATDALPFTPDTDGDGHGDPSGAVTMACEAPMGMGPPDDCDETNDTIYGGAPELCDTLDNDCDRARDEEGCPCDSVEHGGHIYLFCGGANWTTARDRCLSHGYALVTIDDGAENDWVRSEANAHSLTGDLWIGYNDRSSEGSFEWQGPTSSTGFTRWHGGEPSNGGCPLDILCSEDCVEIYADGTWNDQPCDDSRGYVCEAP